MEMLVTKSPLLEMFADLQISPIVTLPPSIIIDHRGIGVMDPKTKEAIGISPDPFFLSAKVFDLDEEIEKWEFTYRYEGKWKKLVEPRSSFSDPRKLIALADRSFPVDAINGREIMKLIREMGLHSKVPIIYAVSSGGWKKFNSKSYFSWGKKIIGASNGDVVFVTSDANVEKLIKSFNTEGNADEWMKLANHLLDHFPQAAISIFHALTAPLMKIVKAPNYCVDVSGPSAVGKSTFSRIAASVWGVPSGPNELLKSWNMTRVFGERYPSLFSDMPMFLEETHLAKEDMQRDYLYMIINGIGRGRGSLKSVQEVRDWNVCLFSTGEMSLLQSTQLEGAKSRVISYWDSPFGDKPQVELIKRIERCLASNYGHIGPAFVQYLIDNQEMWPSLKERYEQIYRHLAAQLRSNIETRVAAYFSLLWLAGEIYCEVFKGKLPEGFDIKQFMQDHFIEATDKMRDIPMWQKALEATRAWVVSNLPSFIKNPSDMDTAGETFSREHLGVWRDKGDDEEQVCIIPTKLKKFLKDEGFPFDSIMRTWKKNNVTQCSTDSITLPVTLKGKTSRLIVLNWVDKPASNG